MTAEHDCCGWGPTPPRELNFSKFDIEFDREREAVFCNDIEIDGPGGYDLFSVAADVVIGRELVECGGAGGNADLYYLDCLERLDNLTITPQHKTNLAALARELGGWPMFEKRIRRAMAGTVSDWLDKHAIDDAIPAGGM